MSRAIPTHVITAMISELTAKLAALRGVPFGEQSRAYLESQIAMLTDLVDAGQASADDLLDRKEAMEWSGLGKDALDAYPHVGSYNSKRWRRGDLKIIDPFGTAGRQTDIQPLQTPTGDEAAAEQAAAQAKAEKLRRALEESRAA